MENSPQFPCGFAFHLQPKFLREFPSTMYPPSLGIPLRIRVILPAGLFGHNRPCFSQARSGICANNLRYLLCKSALLFRPSEVLGISRNKELVKFTDISSRYIQILQNYPSSQRLWQLNKCLFILLEFICSQMGITEMAGT